MKLTFFQSEIRCCQSSCLKPLSFPQHSFLRVLNHNSLSANARMTDLSRILALSAKWKVWNQMHNAWGLTHEIYMRSWQSPQSTNWTLPSQTKKEKGDWLMTSEPMWKCLIEFLGISKCNQSQPKERIGPYAPWIPCCVRQPKCYIWDCCIWERNSSKNWNRL